MADTDHQGHNHHHQVSGKRLGITIFLNVLITAAQVAGAVVSGSLALLTDALHNFSDVLALLLSWVANRLARRERTPRKSFGFKRAEIVAAFINAASLTVIAVLIAEEAISRLAAPPEVRSGIVMALGGLSIVLNGLSVLLVKRDSKENLNIRSAYLHLLTDMLTSVAVVVGGAVMYYTGINWIDSVVSLVIAGYLIYASWGLLIGSLRILMQFAPREVDVAAMTAALRKIAEVKDVHHIHVWQLNDREVHFEAHVVLCEDLRISETDRVMDQVRRVLREEFAISHVTLQSEVECSDAPAEKRKRREP